MIRSRLTDADDLLGSSGGLHPVGEPDFVCLRTETFEHFGRAVRTKLVREISGVDLMGHPERFPA